MEAWAPFFGGLGTFFVSIINFSPIPGFIGLWKSKDVRYVPHTFFVLINVNAMLWFSMGLVNNLPDMVRSNGMSLLFTYAYLLVIHLIKQDALTFMTVYSLLLSLVAYGLVMYVPPSTITMIAGINNTLMAISPLEKVKNVIKEKNNKYIDIVINGISLPTNFCWMMYGVCINSLPLVVPNVIGVLSCSTLIILYFLYREPKAKAH